MKTSSEIMATKALVNDTLKVLKSFQNEGRDFRFAALVPVYPGLGSTSYILLVDAEWLDNMTFHEAAVILTTRIFSVIQDVNIRKKINRVDVWLKGGVYERGVEAEILIDKVGLSRYFNYPQAATSGEDMLANFLPIF